MKMERILITGSEGNIGSVLVPYLASESRSILRVDVVHKYDRNYIMSDVTNLGDLFKLYDEFSPHIVIHMAAKVSRISSEKSPCLTVDTNISGLHNIIQLCLRNKAKLIYFSTSEVYGNVHNPLSETADCKPNNIYGLTKYLGENIVEYYVINYRLKAVTLRPFMIYNENQIHGEDKAFINRLVYSLMNKEKIRVHKDSNRSWLNISDAVKLIEKSFYVDEYSIINIGHENIINTQDLARKICGKLGLVYDEYIIEEEQPYKMTLNKEPLLLNQKLLLQYDPIIDIDSGIDMIIKKYENTYYNRG